MKTARLHDGRVMQFPDEFTPEQIKSHVKATIKGDAARAKSDAASDTRHKESIKATQQVAKSTADGMDGIGKRLDKSTVALAALASKLGGIDEIAGAVSELSENIGSLEKAIVASTAAIIKVLKSPRKITTNTKGKPTGMMIGDDE